MRYNFYIDYDGLGYIPAYPDSIAPFEFSVNESDRMQSFYRLGWGKIQFSNRPKQYAVASESGYRLFDYIDTLQFNQRVWVKFTTTLITIIGYFSRNDCTFDYERKIVTVEPAIYDRYTDVLENWEAEVSFKKYPYTTDTIIADSVNPNLVTVKDWPWRSYYDIVNDAYFEPYNRIYPRNLVKETDYDDAGGIATYFEANGSPKEELWVDSYWMFEGTARIWDTTPYSWGDYSLQDRVDILGQEGTPELDDHWGDYELSMMRVYEGSRTGGLSGIRWRQMYCETEFTREENIKIDVVDEAEEYGFKPPVGDGWHLRSAQIKEGKPAHLWTRLPFGGAFSDNSLYWEIQPEVVNTGISTTDFSWYRYIESRRMYQDPDNEFELVGSIGLRDFLNYLLQNSATELNTMEIKSTFFFNDFEEEISLLNGTTGFNYVTGKLNFLNNCRVFFTKDLVQLAEGEKPEVPRYTFQDILQDLNKTFADKLIWFIDDAGYFRIEHTRYTDFIKDILDLSADTLLRFTTQWSYDKAKMFKRFEYYQMNAGYPDFTENEITYDKIVSNNRNKDLKTEVRTMHISTDIKYAILNASKLDKGIILITVDSNDHVTSKVGMISGEIEINGELALSNILVEFAKYDGVFNEGDINGLPSYFLTTMRIKTGIELKFKGLQVSMFYKTQLGVGILTKGVIDFENENTSFTLKYRNDSSAMGDLFAIVFQKETDFAGAVNAWADIDNYISI